MTDNDTKQELGYRWGELVTGQVDSAVCVHIRQYAGVDRMMTSIVSSVVAFPMTPTIQNKSSAIADIISRCRTGYYH
jgi:hypothetical protein